MHLPLRLVRLACGAPVLILCGDLLAHHRLALLSRSGRVVIVFGRLAEPERRVLLGDAHRLHDAGAAAAEAAATLPPHFLKQRVASIKLGQMLIKAGSRRRIERQGQVFGSVSLLDGR